MSKVHSYKTLGKTLILQGWGRSTDKTVKEILTPMQGDELQVCLLAAMLEELSEVKDLLADVVRRYRTREGDVKCISSGMLCAMKHPYKDKPQKTNNLWMGLSVRALKLLHKLQPKHPSDIVREALLGFRGAGQVTVNELLEYRKRIEETGVIPEGSGMTWADEPIETTANRS